MRRCVALFALALTLGLVARAPVLAQAPTRVPTIGVLIPGPATAPSAVPSREAFERGLKELGWTPGQTVRVEYRYADGKLERLRDLAQELAGAKIDVLVARSTQAIRVAKEATTTGPIVMSASGLDPVQLGFVASLARPGGNITGLTLLNDELTVKQLELLKEVVPRMSRVAALGSSAVALTPKGRQALDSAARTLGIQLLHVEVRDSVGLDSAFADAVRANANAVLIRADPFVMEANDRRVVTLADKHRLPAVYWMDTYAQLGGLMSYGADLLDVHRRSASYVDRILKGARPADLPIEEPAKFELIVNLKTARTLGLTVPPSVLARANEVIK
jgi:putative ABC transport system substrate-binding protein